MKTIITVISLSIALTWIATATGLTHHNERVTPAPGSTSSPTETPTPAPSGEPAERCTSPEYYDPYMDRCRLPEDDYTPTPGPEWGADIQATIDADPYDNDYQYIEWCFDYVDGGTRIVYYPCGETPQP